MLQYNDLSLKIRELSTKQMAPSLKVFQEIFKDECSQFNKCFSFYACIYDQEELLIISFHPPKDSALYLSTSPLSLFISRQKIVGDPLHTNDVDQEDEDEDDGTINEGQNPTLKWFYDLVDLAEFCWKDYFEWLETDHHADEDDDGPLGPYWQQMEETELFTNPIFIKMSRENIELTIKADLLLAQDSLH